MPFAPLARAFRTVIAGAQAPSNPPPASHGRPQQEPGCSVIIGPWQPPAKLRRSAKFKVHVGRPGGIRTRELVVYGPHPTTGCGGDQLAAHCQKRRISLELSMLAAMIGGGAKRRGASTGLIPWTFKRPVHRGPTGPSRAACRRKGARPTRRARRAARSSPAPQVAAAAGRPPSRAARRAARHARQRTHGHRQHKRGHAVPR